MDRLEMYLQSSLVSELLLTLPAGELEPLVSGLDVGRQVYQPGKREATMAAGELGTSVSVLSSGVGGQLVLCSTLNSTLGTQVGHTSVLRLHVNPQPGSLGSFELTERARKVQTSMLGSAVSNQTFLTVECDSTLRATIIALSGIFRTEFFYCCRSTSGTFWIFLSFDFHILGICVFLN